MSKPVTSQARLFVLSCKEKYRERRSSSTEDAEKKKNDVETAGCARVILMSESQAQKKGEKASVNWRCFHCFPGFGGKTPKTELTGAESSKSQLQLKLTESDESLVQGYLRTEDHVNGSGKRKGLSSSSEGAGHLSQLGMDWSGEERASTSKSDGTMKHLETGDAYNGHGKASTNSSQRAKDGKRVGSAAKKHGKRPKY